MKQSIQEWTKSGLRKEKTTKNCTRLISDENTLNSLSRLADFLISYVSKMDGV